MKNNPYVGPRPYERQDRHSFFGRAREARDLLALVKAERAVLFYAQSGAGKTSLLNAQIIPALEEEGFHSLPVTRVGSDPPPGVEKSIPNIFAFSALMGLAGKDVPANTLLHHTLLSFLRQAVQTSEVSQDLEGLGRPPILFLDQFEEILTTHRDRWRDAQGFFLQLQVALREMPTLGVVLAMREDHLAGLDPYVPLLPKRLRTRFRMELLGREAALEAVKRPAQDAGCPFADGVAERLVDDLSRIKALPSLVAERDGGRSGDGDTVIGPYVEPVQLQVVCQRLWENLPDAARTDHAIQWEEVGQFGNIDLALTDFYESALNLVEAPESLQGWTVTERQLRRWFSEQLITPMQTRGLALRGEKETAGLPNAAVSILENRHLIRADVRAGSTWYELSHDRLVEPILQSNRAWEAARQTPLRMTAKRWQEIKNIGLFYRDKALKEALAWAEAYPGEVEPYEQEFLQASQEAERIRARTRRFAIAGAVVGVIVLAAMALLTLFAIRGQRSAQSAQATAIVESYFRATAQAKAEANAQSLATAEVIAVEQRDAAQQQARIAVSRQLAAEAMVRRNSQFDLSLLLSVESFRTHDTTEARGSLLTGVLEHPQLISYLWGQPKTVKSVAFSPDGKMLVSWSLDKTVTLWDVATHQAIDQPLKGDTDIGFSGAFSPDGKMLATSSRDGIITLWNVTSHPPVGVPLLGDTPGVWSMAFSPDGTMLASGGTDRTIILWDVTTRQPIGQPLTGHTDVVNSLAFSLDGEMLASGSCAEQDAHYNCTRGEIILWDVTTRQPIGQPLKEHTNWVSRVAFNPDGKMLASASRDRTVILWNVATRQSIGSLKGHTSSVESVVFSPDGKTLASGSDDKTITLWNVATRKPVGTQFTGHISGVSSMVFDPDGKTLASGSEDGTIILWNVTTHLPVQDQLNGHTDIVSSVAFSPDGKMLASGSFDKTIILWDMATRQPVGVPVEGDTFAVSSIAFSPDGKTLAAGSERGTITLLNVDTRLPVRLERAFNSQGEMIRGHTGIVSSMAFSPDGKTLASGSQGPWVNIILWNMAAPQHVGVTTKGYTGIVSSVAFSPDGKMLASGSSDKTIILWDMVTRQAIGQPLEGHTDIVTSVAFSPDDKTLASGSFDKTIILWDMATRQPLGLPLKGHTDFVTSVAFSPDGKTLASASRDRTVILWNVATRQPIGSLKGHTDVVSSVASSPDGKTLASGSNDKTIILWDVSPESWQERACGIANRNLTRAEWAQYINPDPSTYRATCQELPLEPEPTPIPVPTAAP